MFTTSFVHTTTLLFVFMYIKITHICMGFFPPSPLTCLLKFKLQFVNSN